MTLSGSRGDRMAGPPLFFGCTALGGVGLINARTPGQYGVAVAVVLAAGYGAAGTIGDLQLIMLKLSQGNSGRKS